jgi:hypothetical protein
LGFIALILLVSLGAFPFVFYSFFSFHRIRKRVKQKSFQRVRTVYEMLMNNSLVSVSDIYPYARDPVTREFTYRLLYYFDQEFLFPPVFCTMEAEHVSRISSYRQSKNVNDVISFWICVTSSRVKMPTFGVYFKHGK